MLATKLPVISLAIFNLKTIVFRRWVLAGILAVTVGQTTAQASFLLQNCESGADISSWVKSGYKGWQWRPVDFGTDASQVRSIPSQDPDKDTRTHKLMPPATTSYPAMDIAEIYGRSRLTLGEPAGPASIDTARFHFDGVLGATDSRNGKGYLAWARATGVASFDYHTDAGVYDIDGVVGEMRVGPVRKLRKYEFLLRVDVFEEGKLVHRSLPGAKTFAMPVMEDTAYQVKMFYGIKIPPTQDPPFRVDHWTTLTPLVPVPEPASISILLCGGIALLARRPRRRK